MVSACWVVNTGQSASFNTFAGVEPSSILRKRPACVGMMMRSNPFFLASWVICVDATPNNRILGHSSEWKLRLEKRVEFVSSKVLLLFGNLGE